MSGDWERDVYSAGKQLNRYPWDHVVSFLFRHRQQTAANVLEVGCGSGNNLWFAAREGCAVTGIDASPSAIAYARKRFAEEGLKGDFRVVDFREPLGLAEGSFDLIIDRSALTYLPPDQLVPVVARLRALLKPGGKFLFNPFGQGMTAAPTGQPYFYDREEISRVLIGWKILCLQRVTAETEQPRETLVEWRVIASPSTTG